MKPLAITAGDPAGIGPSISVSAAVAAGRVDPSLGLIIYGAGERLRASVEAEGAVCASAEEVLAGAPGIGVVDVGDVSPSTVKAHGPTIEGGRAQLAALDAAADAALAGEVRGIVTAPVAKEAIEMAGVHFTGHTEHLAARAGLPRDAVSMLFLGPKLKVALVTTHLAVRDAAAAITTARVTRTVRHLHDALSRLDSGTPRIVVTGVNPHAGEGGLFGREELETIAPALDALRTEPAFATLAGPRPAEAAFRQAAAGSWDGVVTMLHDQATIAAKLLDWGESVNVTWGLPFVRVSVDHGVAYDAAADGSGSDRGMRAALALGDALTRAS